MSLMNLDPEAFFAKLEALDEALDEDGIADIDVIQTTLTILAHTRSWGELDISSISTDDIDDIVFPIRLKIRVVGNVNLSQTVIDIKVMQNKNFEYTDEQKGLIDEFQNRASLVGTPIKLARAVFYEVRQVLSPKIVNNGIKLLPLDEEAGFGKVTAYKRAENLIYPEVIQPS